MRNEIKAMITDITTTTAEAEDYTGEDGLLYCGKCHTPKEAYFPKETAQWLGHDRHPAECDCQRAAREKRDQYGKKRIKALWLLSHDSIYGCPHFFPLRLLCSVA